MNLEKAKILDAILLKFTGNITITWHQLQQGLCNDIETYHVIENNINYLVGDGQLERDVAQAFSLSMTDKGFATMTDLANLGYVTAAKKERNNRRWAIVGGVLTGLTFIILVYTTWFQGKQSNNPPTETKDTSNMKSLEQPKLNNTHLSSDTATATTDTTPKQKLPQTKQVKGGSEINQ